MNNTVGAKTLVACQTVLPSAFVIDSGKQKPQNNNQKMCFMTQFVSVLSCHPCSACRYNTGLSF